ERVQREPIAALRIDAAEIDRECPRPKQRCHLLAGVLVRQVEEEIDILRAERIAALRAQVLDQVLIPVVGLFLADAANREIQADHGHQRGQHEQPGDELRMHERRSYSSGAIVTRSPSSSALSGIWQERREVAGRYDTRSRIMSVSSDMGFASFGTHAS